MRRQALLYYVDDGAQQICRGLRRRGFTKFDCSACSGRRHFYCKSSVPSENDKLPLQAEDRYSAFADFSKQLICCASKSRFVGTGPDRAGRKGLRLLVSYYSVGIESDPMACRTAAAAGRRYQCQRGRSSTRGTVLLGHERPRSAEVARFRSIPSAPAQREKGAFPAPSPNGQSRIRTGDTTIFRGA